MKSGQKSDSRLQLDIIPSLLDGGVGLLEHESVRFVLEEDVRLEEVLEEGIDAGAEAEEAGHVITRLPQRLHRATSVRLVDGVAQEPEGRQFNEITKSLEEKHTNFRLFICLI